MKKLFLSLGSVVAITLMVSFTTTSGNEAKVNLRISPQKQSPHPSVG
ncbi:MAG: hypothetical protein ACK47E_10455 [Cyclobacteriaceae bacterium]